MGVENNLKFTQFNNNTAVLDIGRLPLSLNDLITISSPKIRTRLNINMSRLNGLATTIVTPEAIKRINMQVLRQILDFSNRSNTHIGLPTSEALIIRSSFPPSFRLGKCQKTELSEPALLINNINSSPSYKLMERQNKPRNIDSIDTYLDMLHPNTFLMVHDDNYTLQTSGIHGVICDQRQGSELFLRTGSLQARNMGDSSSGYPTIRINATYVEDLFVIHPVDGFNAVTNGNKLQSMRVSLGVQNCQPTDAVKLLTITRTDQENIQYSHRRAQKLFGPEVSTEFRIYPNLGGFVGERLHVLDVN